MFYRKAFLFLFYFISFYYILITLISDKNIAVDHFPLIVPQDPILSETSSNNDVNDNETLDVQIPSSPGPEDNQTDTDLPLNTDINQNLISHKIKILSDFSNDANHQIQIINFEERIETFNLHEKQKNLDLRAREEKINVFEAQLTSKENTTADKKTHPNQMTVDRYAE